MAGVGALLFAQAARTARLLGGSVLHIVSDPNACAWGQIERHDVLELLSSLVGKSLVVAETLQAGEAHYHLLETIRQYAQEKLAASADWVTAHDHYLACYLRLTEDVSPKLRQQYQQLWFNWLETEHAFLEESLALARRQGQLQCHPRHVRPAAH